MKKLYFVILYTVSFLISAKGYVEGQKEYLPYENINELEISIDTGDIDIVTEYRDNILVELTTYKHGPELYIDRGRNTKIEAKRPPFSFFNFSSDKARLLIVLPENFDASLDISASSGDIELRKITCDDLKVSISSGSLTANNIKADKSNLHTSSGYIEVDNIICNNIDISISSGDLSMTNFIGELDGRISSGDVDLYTRRLTDNIDFRISSGDFNLYLKNKDLNGKLDLKTSSGKIYVDFPVTIIDMDNNKRLEAESGDSNNLVYVRISSGDVVIE